MGSPGPRHRWSAAIYRRLLNVLPHSISRAHGDEMVQAFRSSLRDATARAGLRGFMGTWVASLADVGKSALCERVELRRSRRSAKLRARPLEEVSSPSAGVWRAALQDLPADARLASRRLVRAPLFTLTVLITLGLGIGVNTATFQVVNEILRRPLPFPEPERLVFITTEAPSLNILAGKVSQQVAWAWQDDITALDDVATLDMGLFTLAGEDGAESVAVRGFQVSSNLFAVLGVGPNLGRAFVPEESLVGRDGVAILGHGLWQRRYGAAPDVVGRTITVDGRGRTIVGVLPQDFEDPLGGLGAATDLYIPLAIQPGSGLAVSSWLFSFGRLASGATLEEARAELVAHWSRMAEENPAIFSPAISVGVTGLTEATRADVQVALRLALGATVFVLLIVCANLCGLLLARGAQGGRDVAIRCAIGGSRYRVMRQALVESLLLAGMGGFGGLWVAHSFASILERAMGVDVPRLAELHFDADVFAFIAGVSLVSALAFGLLPALSLSRSDPQSVLKESDGLGGARRGQRTQDVLVVSQMAFAVVLMVGAGLFLKSFAALSAVDPGFDTDGVLTFEVLLPSSPYADAERIRLFHDDFSQSLAGIRDVVAVGATSKRPLGTRWGCRGLLPEGRPVPQTASEWPCGESHIATPGYFAAMGITTVRGRTFDAADGSDGRAVAIISEALATELWPGENPVGRRLLWFADVTAGGSGLEVVGVVEAVAHIGLDLPPAATVYEPLGQVVDRRMTYAIKVAGDPGDAVPAVRDAMNRMDRTLHLRQLDTMSDVVAGAVQPYLVASLFLIALAVTGLFLSMAGVYALISGRITRRIREIGLRLALGAGSGEVVREIVRQGLKLGLVAAVVGLGGALLMGRALEGLLFDVKPVDPPTLMGVSALVVLVAVFAAYIPARSAAGVDPTEALRDG